MTVYSDTECSYTQTNDWTKAATNAAVGVLVSSIRKRHVIMGILALIPVIVRVLCVCSTYTVNGLEKDGVS